MFYIYLLFFALLPCTSRNIISYNIRFRTRKPKTALFLIYIMKTTIY